MWDIKSAVRNVDPRVASRAEQIAQEMTILAAIDSMAEQSRREAEKASLGMSVKTVADASPTEGNFTADMERQVPLSPGESEGDKAEEAEDGKGGRSAIPDGSLGRKGGAQEISNSQSGAGRSTRDFSCPFPLSGRIVRCDWCEGHQEELGRTWMLGVLGVPAKEKGIEDLRGAARV